MQYEYDLIVVGSGPAGSRAAIQGVKLGKRVALIEQHGFEGGNYLHNGTVPSKTLREAVLKLTGRSSILSSAASSCDAGMAPGECDGIGFDDLEREIRSVIEYEVDIVRDQLERNQVVVLAGKAQLLDRHCVEVSNPDGSSQQISADHIVLATGSVPRNPDDVPIDNEVIFDSTGLLQAGRIPRSMIVIGGGVIGTEYASIFAHLGVRVQLLDRGERPLRFLDAEIGDMLLELLAKQGMEFIPDQSVERIYRDGDQGVVETDSGQYRADLVLYALGRTANIEGLGLENVGIECNQYGYIAANDFCQTSAPNIYAVGDVIGWPSLASTSAVQGQKTVAQMFKASAYRFPDRFPFGIYTIPEISMIGMSSEECHQKGYASATGRAYYRELPRGIIAGDIGGMLKLVFHRDTCEILGVHIIGTGATDLIHTGYLAMEHRLKLDDFTHIVFNTPTFSEAYRVAAFNGKKELGTS